MGLGRYRPPQPKPSLYITAEGFEALRTELNGLWRRRADVTQALAAAAAEGDRSENAEYIYRKKELRGIDRRIRYLQKRLPDLNVVREQPGDQSRVFFGAWVILEDDAGHEHLFRIVGPDEINPKTGWISIDAPLGRALLKKAVDDEVTIEVAGQHTQYTVTDIRYQPPSSP